MTREELVEIMTSSGEYEFDADIAADRIVAALAKERENEVVLYSGMCKIGEPDFQVFKGREDQESVVLVPVPYSVIKGKRGTLIFRRDV